MQNCKCLFQRPFYLMKIEEKLQIKQMFPYYPTNLAKDHIYINHFINLFYYNL